MAEQRPGVEATANEPGQRALSVGALVKRLAQQDPDLTGPPPLDDLYSEPHRQYRCLVSYNDVGRSVPVARELAGRNRVSALAAMSRWLPRLEGEALGHEAIGYLLLILDETERVEAAIDCIWQLDGFVDQRYLRSALRSVSASLHSAHARAVMWCSHPGIFGAEARQLSEVLLRVSDETQRLDAFERVTLDAARKDVASFDKVVKSFTDPTLRVKALTRVLMPIPFGKIDRTLGHPTELITTIEEATDVQARNEAFTYLAMALPERWSARIEIRQDRLNRSLRDPQIRAASLLESVGLSRSEKANERLVLDALRASSDIAEEAERCAILERYVRCIPGTPPWGEKLALDLACSLSDERLKAKGLSALLILPKISQRVIKVGLQLTDAWARAEVMFAWPSWAEPPPGFTKRAWLEACTEVAELVPRSAVRARYLSLAALQAKGKRRADLASAALEAVRRPDDPWMRVRVLDQLLRHGLINRSLGVEALEAARLIPPVGTRVRALARLSQHQDADTFALLLRELLGAVYAPGETVDVASLLFHVSESIDLSWPTEYLDLGSTHDE